MIATIPWCCAWVSEIDPFARAVVEHHWNAPNLGDVTLITEEAIREHGAIDLVAGGTPCQSFSLAGLRKGLDDPRGNLALVFLRIVEMARPRWVLWENVPGVLSSNRGRDFGAFLAALGQLGYSSICATFCAGPVGRRWFFTLSRVRLDCPLQWSHPWVR
jgi:DNA (cytosine-5)-methyltransferase 1